MATLATAGLSAPPSYAQQAQTAADSPARLNAQRYQEMDAGQPIYVQIFEDSDQSLALAEGLKQSLTKAGYVVTAKGAPLVLSFELTGQGEGSTAGQSSILSVEGSNSQSVDQRYQAHLDVFSSTQQSLMTGQGRSPRVTSPGAHIRYQLYLNDRATGQRLWEGWATAPLLPQGAEATALAMSDPLIGVLGETVRDRGIPLGHP
jgi:hypothetical protein